ncbi:MAG: hypothetical protein K8S00_12140 [Bacteroidales bacterium]|nr:hypothetical protein [Bacteroidales bacterium]
MQRFEKSVEIILSHEGGYINDPKDPGGETNFGISKRAFPNLDIKNLTKEQAKAIYYEKYWKPIQLDKFSDELLALHVFDFGVNAGVSRAVKLLQNFLDIKADGIIGPISIREINTYPMPGRLRNFYIDARKDFYKIIVKNRPTSRRFLKGWINRVNSCKFQNPTK